MKSKLLTEQEVLELENRYVPNGDVYPLWGFVCDRGLIFTRGRTSEEAWEYVRHDFYLNEHVAECDSLPTRCLELYNVNHKPGWLTRPPVWLLRQMFKV